MRGLGLCGEIIQVSPTHLLALSSLAGYQGNCWVNPLRTGQIWTAVLLLKTAVTRMAGHITHWKGWNAFCPKASLSAWRRHPNTQTLGWAYEEKGEG